MNEPSKLVFDGMIKARVPKTVETQFNRAARRRLKKVPELAREVFNDFLAREKADGKQVVA